MSTTKLAHASKMAVSALAVTTASGLALAAPASAAPAKNVPTPTVAQFESSLKLRAKKDAASRSTLVAFEKLTPANKQLFVKTVSDPTLMQKMQSKTTMPKGVSEVFSEHTSAAPAAKSSSIKGTVATPATTYIVTSQWSSGLKFLGITIFTFHQKFVYQVISGRGVQALYNCYGWFSGFSGLDVIENNSWDYHDSSSTAVCVTDFSVSLIYKDFGLLHYVKEGTMWVNGSGITNWDLVNL